MSKSMLKLGRASFAIAVTIALGFGANQALASSAPREDCQPCATQAECDSCCKEFDFDGGDCFVPNCLCY